MRKLSLLLSLLFSFVSVVSLSHASSGDITIGTKTYTQSEAQKQIVEPLLKRLEKQKITKTKLRLINLAIRQYTNKQKIAQKQGKIDIATFYSEVIDTLKGKVNIIGTGSTNSSTGSQGIGRITKTNTGTTGGSTIGGTSTNDYNGMTQTEKEQSRIRQDINSTLTLAKSLGTTQNEFLKEISSKYGIGSYAYKYAQTLSFGNSTSSVNQGGLGTTSSQTGLAGKAQEESIVRGQVNEDYNIYIKMKLSREDFLKEITSKYGGTSSYAYQYAQTLSFGSSSTYNANQGGLGTTSDQTGLTGQAYDEAKTQGEVMTTYNNVITNPNITKAQFLQAIAEDFGGTSSYAYKYAQTLSFSK